MKNRPARCTIADVARYAGVSKATVSRFLNHRETLLSPQIAERVEAAVQALGYVPSPMARALKRGRSRLIGLVVADIANPYSVAVLRGAEHVCRQAGFLVMLFNLGNEIARETAGLRALSSYQVEGFILNTMGHDAGSLIETATHGKPIVLVDRQHRGLDVDFISLDNEHAVRACVDHLRAQGYRDLVLVSEPLGLVSSRIERARAFEEYARADQGDASLQVVQSPIGDPTELIAALRKLRPRGRQRRPAIITANAVITLQVVQAVAELGWQLGRDVGLVGIDDTPWAPYVGPGVSAMAQPTDRIGELAAQCLLQRIGGFAEAARVIRLPGTLMTRGSTRPQA